LNIDPTDIEARITPRTKAIIAVSLQGCPADMAPILEIARKHKLRVLEDFSQCVGGRYGGKYLGSMGDIGISSFRQGKAIRYGRECCPQTIDVQGRLGGVIMDPNFTNEDINDIVAAIRKVYLALNVA
jgi:dTDP-4-amino-4,6-dideoxygalactose transaminase